MNVIGPVGTHVTALANQHIIVDFDQADQKAIDDGAIIVGLPAPTLDSHGRRVRVTDVAADGGLGSGMALRIEAQFATLVGGNYAKSGYVVANDGSGSGNVLIGKSRRGATIELLDLGIQKGGWIIVSEGCQPMAPPNEPTLVNSAAQAVRRWVSKMWYKDGK